MLISYGFSVELLNNMDSHVKANFEDTAHVGVRAGVSRMLRFQFIFYVLFGC